MAKKNLHLRLHVLKFEVSPCSAEGSLQALQPATLWFPPAKVQQVPQNNEISDEKKHLLTWSWCIMIYLFWLKFAGLLNDLMIWTGSSFDMFFWYFLPLLGDVIQYDHLIFFKWLKPPASSLQDCLNRSFGPWSMVWGESLVEHCRSSIPLSENNLNTEREIPEYEPYSISCEASKSLWFPHMFLGLLFTSNFSIWDEENYANPQLLSQGSYFHPYI